jgi:hypothetical protein
MFTALKGLIRESFLSILRFARKESI